MKNISIWLCCALLAMPAAVRAQDPPPASVDEKLEELDQKIRVLDRKIEIDKEAAAEKAKTAGQAVAGKDGFSLRSADGNFVLKVRGYAHFDGRFWVDDEKRPQAETFLLRRVRPIFEGTVYKIFDFRIMPDFGAGTTVLQDAYIEGRFNPAFRVRAGKFKPPVGLERLQSATDILFVERALPDQPGAQPRPRRPDRRRSRRRDGELRPRRLQRRGRPRQRRRRHQQRQGPGGPRLLPAVREGDRTAQEPGLRHRGEPGGPERNAHGHQPARPTARPDSRPSSPTARTRPPPAPRWPTAPAPGSPPRGTSTADRSACSPST